MVRGRRGRPKQFPHSSPSTRQDSTPEAEPGSPISLLPATPANTSVSITRLISSYASLVDPDEGTNMQFTPAYDIYGKKCAKLLNEDVKEEIEYWQNAPICSVLRVNPPFEVMKGFIYPFWANFELDKMLQLHKGICEFARQNPSGKKGLYYFDSKPFLVKSWNLKMDMQTEAINVLGILIKTDKYTNEKTWISYARVLIDIPIGGPFTH
ncbi:hypothetical protein Cgig2_001150 [Carnegiea gigantea]|uniref:Uncharacterized protein n=1 Tax=Carnegiea gigantea TaxID=171969 RepID=A0A9Q1QBI2_9CARY|nr:hypothetical protein Cgig2_001150 [Carnegiea gigantea]